MKSMTCKHIVAIAAVLLCVCTGRFGSGQRRLAAVARRKSRRHFKGHGTTKAVAGEWPAARLEGYWCRQWLFVFLSCEWPAVYDGTPGHS